MVQVTAKHIMHGNIFDAPVFIHQYVETYLVVQVTAKHIMHGNIFDASRFYSSID